MLGFFKKTFIWTAAIATIGMIGSYFYSNFDYMTNKIYSYIDVNYHPPMGSEGLYQMFIILFLAVTILITLINLGCFFYHLDKKDNDWCQNCLIMMSMYIPSLGVFVIFGLISLAIYVQSLLLYSLMH